MKVLLKLCSALDGQKSTFVLGCQNCCCQIKLHWRMAIWWIQCLLQLSASMWLIRSDSSNSELTFMRRNFFTVFFCFSVFNATSVSTWYNATVSISFECILSSRYMSKRNDYIVTGFFISGKWQNWTGRKNVDVKCDHTKFKKLVLSALLEKIGSEVSDLSLTWTISSFFAGWVWTRWLLGELLKTLKACEWHLSCDKKIWSQTPTGAYFFPPTVSSSLSIYTSRTYGAGFSLASHYFQERVVLKTTWIFQLGFLELKHDVFRSLCIFEKNSFSLTLEQGDCFLIFKGLFCL